MTGSVTGWEIVLSLCFPPLSLSPSLSLSLSLSLQYNEVTSLHPVNLQKKKKKTEFFLFIKLIFIS